MLRNPIPVTVSKHASALFGVCESFLRAQGSTLDTEFEQTSTQMNTAVVQLVRLCSSSNGCDRQPHVLLALAQQGSQEQQAAFFRLLVTGLKVSATPHIREAAGAGSRSRVWVGEGAVAMLRLCLCCSDVTTSSTATAPAANISDTASSSSSPSRSRKQGNSSSNGTAAALWLLLLGRCGLQWAAELAHMQAVGAHWAQLITQAQQEELQYVTLKSSNPTLNYCFGRSQQQMSGFAQGIVSMLSD
jgi:hypothetical protein